MKQNVLFVILMIIVAGFFTQRVQGQAQADREKAQGYYKQGLEQVEASNFAEAYESFRNAWQLDKGNWDYRWRYMVISSYMGQQALFAGNHEKALELFNTAFSIKHELTNKEDVEYITLKRFIELTEEHKKYYPIKPEYTYKIQVLFIMNSDVKNAFDKKNQPLACKGAIPKAFPDSMIRYHEMLRIYIETLSKGRLSMSFDSQKVDATLTRVRELYGYSPDFDSIQPSLSPLLFEGRNTYDTTLYYWYNGNLPHTIHASWDSGVILVPYTWRSGAVRGRIVLHSGEGGSQMDSISNLPHHWIAFHEFFHHIEYLCGNIAPQHAHLSEEFPKARKNFPDWVPDMNTSWTATEYSWYKYHIQKTVPRRMEELARETGIEPPWRNMSYVNRFPDSTDENLLRTYTDAVKGIALTDLRKAGELVDEGFKLTWSGKNKEAEAKFEQALTYNPYHHAALEQLGWLAIASRNNDFARADRYYGEMARVFPDPKKCLAAGIVFFDRNQAARAVHYFRIAAARRESNPVYTWWTAKALAAAADTGSAESMVSRLGKHPVVSAPLAFINCTAADLSLQAGGFPDDESAPWLWKLYRQPASRWRLVPAGDERHVRLVSEYSWRCLEARGSAGKSSLAMAPVGTSEAQVWVLTQGKDGEWAISSSTLDLALTVVPAAAGKQATLELRRPSDAPLQKWDIQLHDPVAGLMDVYCTISLVSPEGMALDVAGGNTADGTPICRWEWGKDNWNQKWKLMPSGTDGYVLIISAKTLKCVAAVENDGFVKPLQQTITRSDAQLWKLVEKSGGRFQLVNRLNGMALQSDPWNRNSLMLGPIEETDKQLWKIEY